MIFSETEDTSISYRMLEIHDNSSQLIFQISDTLGFRAALWGLGTTYDVHLGLIGKRVVYFLLVLIELFR